MNGRSIFRALAVVLLLAVLAGIGVSVYNAGLAAGFNHAVQQAIQNGQPVPVIPYGYGPYGHGGIGFLGIFLFIIGIFLVFGLIRAAFGMGRGGRGGWGKWGHYPGGPRGPGGPGGSYGGGDRISEWHRELHRREEAGESDTGQGRPTPGA